MIRQFSAGGVVYRIRDNKVWWLMRRGVAGENYRGPVGWTLPKGWIDSGESAQEAAIREVAEEGGVGAIIKAKVGDIKLFFTDEKKEKVFKIVTFFLMEWVRDLPQGHDMETEEVRWGEFEEIREALQYKSEKEILIKASSLCQKTERMTK